MGKKSWFLNATKQLQGEQKVMHEIVKKLQGWCADNDVRGSHLPRDEDKMKFLEDKLGWFLKSIDDLMDEQVKIAQILKEMVDWCFEDDEHGSHNPRGEDKVKDLNEKLRDLQEAQEDVNRYLDVVIAEFYDDESAGPSDPNDHDSDDQTVPEIAASSP